MSVDSLPHGRQFRFVDELLEITPGQKATASWSPSATLEFFQAHFPGHPLVPGVIFVEAIAQLAGIIAQCDPSIPPMKDVRLTAIRQAKILGTVPPETGLTLTAEISGRLGALVQAQGKVSHEGNDLCIAQVTLSGTVDDQK